MSPAARSTRARSRRNGPSKRGTALELAGHGMPRFLEYDSIPTELAEPIRTILNRYEMVHQRQIPTSITVTSAVHREGTTMVSQALATLLAMEHGRFVCWFDCSWLAPNAPTPIDKDPGQPGLIDILGDGSKLLTALRSSPDLPQLTHLSPAPVPDQKRHMIVRSEQFLNLLTLLTEEFDHVIFDAPPLLGGGDGLALLRQTDSYLLAVKQRTTSQSQVRKAVELAMPTPNLAVVLTDYTTKVMPVVQRLLDD